MPEAGGTGGGAGGEESFPELVSRVVDDAKEVARAEVDLVKARAVEKVAGYRAAALLFAGAALLALLAAVGLVVGLLFILSVGLGPGWATLIVAGGLLLLAGLLGWLGSRRWKSA